MTAGTFHFWTASSHPRASRAIPAQAVSLCTTYFYASLWAGAGEASAALCSASPGPCDCPQAAQHSGRQLETNLCQAHVSCKNLIFTQGGQCLDCCSFIQEQKWLIFIDLTDVRLSTWLRFKVVQAQKRLKLMSGFFTSNLEITAFPHEELIFKLLYRVWFLHPSTVLIKLPATTYPSIPTQALR